MSNPVTTVEIQDVLSSIRRLVSDGDKAQPRNQAAVEPQVNVPVDMAKPPASNVESPATQHLTPSADCLILTPDFRVVDADDEAKTDPTTQTAAAHKLDIKDRIEPKAVNDDTAAPSTPPVSEVWDEIEPQKFAPDRVVAINDTDPADRSDLVATIAELEAAISAGDDDYEPDGSEPVLDTIDWPGIIPRVMPDVEDAEVSEVELHDVPDADASAPVEADFSLENDQDVDDLKVDPALEPIEDSADEYTDDDLDDILDARSIVLDDEALGDLVANVVRQELKGDLGEKITRNVRKLVRREIYRILSSQDFD